MKKVKVAFCTDGVYPLTIGGMQKHSRLLIEQLLGYDDLDIVIIHPHQDKLFINALSEIHIPPINKSKNYLLECYRYSKRVYNELLRVNPDIIYSQGLSVWYGVQKFKSKIIVNPHGLEPYQAIGFKDKIKGYPFRRIFNFLFKNSAVVISLGGKLSVILKKRCTTVAEIPNAASIPDKRSHKQSDKNFVKVLFLARFAHNKGINVLFSAFKVLKQQGLLDHFEFTLGGEGPLYNHYQSVNPYKNVKLLGFVNNEQLDKLYREHDLFVLPTLFEGMPTVVLEAMSYSLPIIVSDVGATKTLDDNFNGRIISPGSVHDLVDSFKWFLDLNVKDRKLLSENSYRKFKSNFTWQVVANKYRELFKSIAVKNEWNQTN